MPISSSYSVTIQFAEARLFGPQAGEPWAGGCAVRLVEPLRGEGSFMLHGLGLPGYGLPPSAPGEWAAPLTGDEDARLRELLGRLEVRQAPPVQPGFDGTWYTLSLLGGATELRLVWWAEAPDGWESAAELFEFALTAARRIYGEAAAKRQGGAG